MNVTLDVGIDDEWEQFWTVPFVKVGNTECVSAKYQILLESFSNVC